MSTTRSPRRSGASPRGVEVDDERLAGAILEDGGKTDFLTHPHTMAWFRSELTELHIGNRLQREKWADSGGPDQRRRAQARVEELLAQEWEPVLTEEQERERERIELSWRE